MELSNVFVQLCAVGGISRKRIKLFAVLMEQAVRNYIAKSQAQVTDSSTRDSEGVESLPERGCRLFEGARKSAL